MCVVPRPKVIEQGENPPLQDGAVSLDGQVVRALVDTGRLVQNKLGSYPHVGPRL